MKNKIKLQCNKIIHLENSMVMYGIYNFDSKLDSGCNWYLSKDGVGHYAINFLLWVRTLREKYIKMHEEFISQLYMYAKAIGILSKGNLLISL